MDEEFLEKLDAARDWAAVPFRITSAMRCAKHNAEVGGRPDSRHLTGGAVDIAWTDPHMLGRIDAALLRVGIVSRAISKAGHFIHCDTFEQQWLGLY
jgi:uncharacterized protein YcbK (DUF882 family)